MYYQKNNFKTLGVASTNKAQINNKETMYGVITITLVLAEESVLLGLSCLLGRWYLRHL